MSQAPSLRRWDDAQQVHAFYSRGQHLKTGSRCHRAGRDAAAEASDRSILNGGSGQGR